MIVINMRYSSLSAIPSSVFRLDHFLGEKHDKGFVCLYVLSSILVDAQHLFLNVMKTSGVLLCLSEIPINISPVPAKRAHVLMVSANEMLYDDSRL